MADSRPPKPLGYRPGETYIDMVTGQFKQVQVNGPDIVIPVAARAVEQQESPTTTTAPAKPTNTKPNTQSSPGIKVSAKISDLLARVASIEARIEAIDNANLVPGRETEDVVEYIEPSTGTAVQSTANELRALLGSLNREKNEINKVLKPYSDAQKAYNEAQSGLLRAEEIARNPVTESPGGMSKKEADANVSSARKKVETARKQVDVSMRSVDSAETPKQTTPSTGAKTKPSAQTQTGTTTAAEAPKVTGAVTSMAKNPSARNRIGAGGGGMTGETGGGTGGGGGTGAGGNVGATTVGTGKDGKKKKKGKGAAAADVLAGLDLETLKRDYPGYAWVWDLAPEFNDTKKLWADFLDQKITADRFNNLIGQSSWYTDQRTINETRRIKNRYGDILDGGTLSKLVNESIVFQYKDDELDSAFFTSALSRNVMTGEFVDSRAANAALASNVANSYRNYAKSMFLSTDDTEVEALLTGKMTEEDFTRTKRQVAQATYKNWADLLNDPAMTMDKIVKPWKDMAASVLELDPTQIDMTKPQFSVAYAGTPDGKMGAMSLGDWYVKLRSDSTYGWDKTNQAKQEAQELGYNIAKAFGKA